MILSFEVIGLPKAQPRARAALRPGAKHASIYNPSDANDWKSLVREAAAKLKEDFRQIPIQALRMTIVISLPAPSAWRTPKGKPTKKCPTARYVDWATGIEILPPHSSVDDLREVYADFQKPDWDNLGKSTSDALNPPAKKKTKLNKSGNVVQHRKPIAAPYPGFWHDDAQCHDVRVVRWRSFEPPGAIITVETVG
jgi:Holliday junction resolvase RusA-like endonuclease